MIRQTGKYRSHVGDTKLRNSPIYFTRGDDLDPNSVLKMINAQALRSTSEEVKTADIFNEQIMLDIEHQLPEYTPSPSNLHHEHAIPVPMLGLEDIKQEESPEYNEDEEEIVLQPRHLRKHASAGTPQPHSIPSSPLPRNDKASSMLPHDLIVESTDAQLSTLQATRTNFQHSPEPLPIQAIMSTVHESPQLKQSVKSDIHQSLQKLEDLLAPDEPLKEQTNSQPKLAQLADINNGNLSISTVVPTGEIRQDPRAVDVKLNAIELGGEESESGEEDSEASDEFDEESLEADENGEDGEDDEDEENEWMDESDDPLLSASEKTQTNGLVNDDNITGESDDSDTNTDDIEDEDIIADMVDSDGIDLTILEELELDDFNAPPRSLKKRMKKLGKNAQRILFESDCDALKTPSRWPPNTGLDLELQLQWERDRETKKQKKKMRDELRMNGLLGKKSKKKLLKQEHTIRSKLEHREKRRLEEPTLDQINDDILMFLEDDMMDE